MHNLAGMNFREMLLDCQRPIHLVFATNPAFGQDEVGTIGTPTTINSGDMAGILMIAVQALEKRSKELQAENELLRTRLEALRRA